MASSNQVADLSEELKSPFSDEALAVALEATHWEPRDTRLTVHSPFLAPRVSVEGFSGQSACTRESAEAEVAFAEECSPEAEELTEDDESSYESATTWEKLEDELDLRDETDDRPHAENPSGPLDQGGLGDESSSDSFVEGSAAEDGFDEDELAEALDYSAGEREPSQYAPGEDDEAQTLPKGQSPLAIQARKQWDAQDRPQEWIDRVYGLVVHTTGSGLPSSARDRKVYHTARAVSYYAESHGCHYVNGWRGFEGGDLLQVANEREQANGVGMTNSKEPSKDQRRSVDLNRFEADLPAVLVKLWRARWPQYRNPLELLPGTRTANSCFVHVECVPCVYWHNGRLTRDAEALREGLRFTRAQHDAIALLAVDVARRNGWPSDEMWWRTPRLLGHEDLTPISRHNKEGGWDPGYLREKPFFDWDYVYAAIEEVHRRGASGAQQPARSATGNDSFMSVLGNLTRRFVELVSKGQEALALTLAYERGQTDANQLTNLVFFARHRERDGRPIDPRKESHLSVEWTAIRDRIVRPLLQRFAVDGISAKTSLPAGPVSAPLNAEDRLFHWRPPTATRKYGGYARSGGGRCDERLKELRRAGQLTISDAEIDLLQRIANVESGSQVQAINSWDSAYLSMGFMQWTIKFTDRYSPDGKLQRLIQSAKRAFARYGIELEQGRRYAIKVRKDTYRPRAIRGAEQPDELRRLEWAKRFYAAGLDDEVIVQEARCALEVLAEDLERIKAKVGSGFLAHYDSSVTLRALIHETFNNRPTYLYVALREASARAGNLAAATTEQILELLRKAVRDAYFRNEPSDGLKKADNLIRKTAQP